MTAGPTTLGILGTMVWDRIEHPDGETVERWGGITYSLAAAAAALPTADTSWTLRPIIKLGADLADEGRAFLSQLPGAVDPSAVVDVPEPNNRVHLRYRDRHDRDEQLSGGVPGWTWAELRPHLDGLSGLYVNLISGFELDARTAGALGAGYSGPSYVDVHSLVLGVGPDGLRVPRRPEDPMRWITAFDVVQANAHELDILAGPGGGDALISDAVASGVRAFLVTEGPEGARWHAHGPGPVWPDPDADGRQAVQSGALRSGTERSRGPRTGDPTGCGDVWGATCFVDLMRGASLTAAMGRANRAAAANVNHRGAEGLHRHLRAST